MSLFDNFPSIIEEVQGHDDYFKRNSKLYEVNEGNILPHILEALEKQFSSNTFVQMTHRIPPINVLKRVVDKLSRIYQPGPTRSVVSGADKDSELLSWYEKKFKMNKQMNLSNEYFNLFKNTLIQVCLINGVPTLRPIPSERYFVLGKNPVDPMKPTHVVTLQEGSKKPGNLEKSIIYHIYTDAEFVIVENGKVRLDLMQMYGNEEGVNPYGKLPFVYITRSANELIPMPDSDIYNMSLIIPQGFTDLNAGVMFQIFSIFYGIGVSPENLVYSPNAFWTFKVDPGVEGKTEVGILKPQMDIAQALNLIQSQLSLWLQTIGIRPGVVGQATADSFSSGISKMIDEMDTSEHRMKQIDFFKEGEEQLWNFVINYAHPYWLSTQSLKDQSLAWTPGIEISVNFAEQIPMQSRGEVLKEQLDELNNGLTTKKRVIATLYPQMTSNEIDELLNEVDEDKQINISMQDFNNVSNQDQNQADNQANIEAQDQGQIVA